MSKNWEKFTGDFLYIFLVKTTIYQSLGLHKRRPKLQNKPSALKKKRVHPAL
jgi:hypothetical protein